jgi:hypothetical protein
MFRNSSKLYKKAATFYVSVISFIYLLYVVYSRSQWPRNLRRGSAAACLLILRVWIPPRTWMSVPCECCLLSGWGLCYGLIIRPEESYRVCCVRVWSWSLANEETLAHLGCRAPGGGGVWLELYIKWHQRKHIKHRVVSGFCTILYVMYTNPFFWNTAVCVYVFSGKYTA